jgi:hypothetical protein
MDSAGRKLGNLLQKQSFGSISMFYGRVASVDEDAKTVDVIIDEKHSIGDVSLDVISNGNSGVLIFPAVGSVVVVGMVENRPELPFIISFTTIDKISLKIGQTVINLTDGLIEVNGGGNNGMVLIDPLTQALNSLVSTFNSHTHSNGNNGSPTGTPMTTAQNFNSSDYENTKITQ